MFKIATTINVLNFTVRLEFRKSWGVITGKIDDN
jgi:hypothetical protein